MKYVMYGAGAIGGAIGARLAMAGRDVTLIARGAHLEALQARGLHYRNPAVNEVVRPQAVGHPRDIDWQPDHVVFLTMKSQHTFGALQDLAASAPPEVPVICCQNGIANERLALRQFTNTYAMVVFLPAAHLAPGEVVHYAHDSGGLLDACRFPAGVDEIIRRVTQDLTLAGYTADATDRAVPLKYAKLLQNLGNSLQAVCDNPGDARDIMKLLRDEALAAYAEAGIESATRDEMTDRAGHMGAGEVAGVPRSGGSSWQSLTRGTGDIESDYLNGEISLLGRLHGVPTPANDLLCQLANEAAREGRKPGSLSTADLRAKLAVR